MERESNSADPDSAPQSTTPAKQSLKPSYIVGIGASAGGLDALEKFFRSMATDSHVAFVVVQHLSPDFKSLMNELLARYTSMAIHRVTDGVEVEANAIYLIPPRKDMELRNGRLHLTEIENRESLHLSIDVFFRSLAHEAQDKAIAIVLSGTGSDGSRSLPDVRQFGGLIIVQDPASSGFDGMPRNAVGTGLANIICEPEAMPGHILRHISHPSAEPAISQELANGEEEDEISLIFGALHRRFQIDFSQYKLSTIMRRIDRRMMMINIRNAEDYLRLLLQDPTELDSLYRDLLVEVTVFFRDQPAFDFLQTNVIPDIVTQAKPDDAIRVWVPGCATGEEAYSLAMLFREALEKSGKINEIKLFATDVHQTSIEAASAGLFSEAAVKSVPEYLLQKYFQETHEGYRIRKTLRQIVVFANHNLIQDPPFTKLNLISCRNVLIYLHAEAQQKVLSRFHFGLKTNGYLFLGPSEHIGELNEEFETLDRRWRIFRKRREGKFQDLNVPLHQSPLHISRYVERQQRFYRTRSNVSYDWYDPILERFVPDGFLVNESLELVHVFGNGRDYLSQPMGQATLYVLRYLSGDLLTAVRTALHRVTKEEEPISYTGIRATIGNVEQFLQVTVSAIQGQKQNSLYYLVALSTLAEAPPKVKATEAFDVNEASSARLAALERELQYTKEYLQTTIEELETANEEMQSANEELLASNEELQSTNEELHAVNEELYTVNAEHQRKIEELLQLNNDVTNLQRNSRVSVIFLDQSLQIRQYTPAAADDFNLMPQDIGRPVTHLLYNLNLEHDQLQKYTQAAIQRRESISQEIATPTGKRFIMLVRPYLTETDSVEGVVLTYHDITALKKAEFRVQYQSLMETHVSDAIIITDLHFVIQEWSGAAKMIYGWSTEDAIGQPIHSLLQTIYLNTSLEEMQKSLTLNNSWQGSIMQRRQDKAELFIKTTCSMVFDKGNKPISIVFVNRNLTEQILAEETISHNETLLSLAADIAGLGVFDYSLPPGPTDTYSERWAAILGYTLAELPAAPDRPAWFKSVIHPDDQLVYQQTCDGLFQGQTNHCKMEFRLKKKQGDWIYILENSTVTIRDKNGRASHILGVIQDISPQRERENAIRLLNIQLEDRVHQRTQELYKANLALQTKITEHEQLLESLRSSNEKYNHILDLSSEGVWIIDKNNRIIFANQRLADMLGYTLDEILKRPYRTFMNQTAQTKAAQIILNLQPDTAEEHDLTFKHKEGHDIWTIIAVKTLSDKNGAFNGVIATITDVTRWHNDEARIKTLNDELKENNLILEQLVAERTAELDQTHQNLLTQIQERSQSESTLKTTEAKFETLLNQAPTAILITDAQGTIQLSNSQATKTLGYTPEELVGASLNEFVPENETSNFTKNRRKLLQANNNQTIHLDINLKRRNGTTFPAQLNMAIIQVQEGWLIAYFIIDITNRKNVEATLTAQTNQLKKSNEELQDFAYIVSHDLRAPLRALNTYSRFLAEDYNDILDDEGHEYIAGIAESARHMDILIAGLLAYARIDRPAQNPTLVNVNELLNRLVNNLEPKVIAAITLPNNAPLVWAHEIQLQQIFSNLIDNAVKFSQPNNGSKIIISCEEEADFFTFSVADNGIGIESRYFDKIFGIFQRLHTYEEYEGTGIGLAIVKKAVEKHGGQIWVQSTFNESTTITFSLPKKPLTNPTVQPEEEK